MKQSSDSIKRWFMFLGTGNTRHEYGNRYAKHRSRCIGPQNGIYPLVRDLYAVGGRGGLTGIVFLYRDK